MPISVEREDKPFEMEETPTQKLTRLLEENRGRLLDPRQEPVAKTLTEAEAYRQAEDHLQEIMSKLPRR